MAASSPLAPHFGGIYGKDALFQPPGMSPSRASTPLATGDYFSGGARKRQRSDASQAQESGRTRCSPWTGPPSYEHFPDAYDMLSESYLSQVSLVNEHYHLAGGYDTPSLKTASLLEALHTHNDEPFTRGQMVDGGFSDVAPISYQLLSGPLARERNGIARLNRNQGQAVQPSWTSFAINLVGKMFTFSGSVIRGFYAGGGKGYDLPGSEITPTGSVYDDHEECSTPVPGAWDFGEVIDISEKHDAVSTPSSTTRPPNKRRQTDRDTWIMIGAPDQDGSGLSPSRRPNLTRSSVAGRVGASRASSRRNAPAPPTRASSHYSPNANPVQTHPPSPPTHERRASIASVRSPHARPTNTYASTASVISPEAERYMRRQVKQDRAADKAMNSMSRRLEDLIRQGQEALGTKYSVEGDDEMIEDEGFVDEIY